MTDNRFCIHKQDIKKISEEKGVEVGVAARMLAHEMDWENYQAELTAFDDLCVQFMRRPTKTLADLFEE